MIMECGHHRGLIAWVTVHPIAFSKGKNNARLSTNKCRHKRSITEPIPISVHAATARPAPEAVLAELLAYLHDRVSGRLENVDTALSEVVTEGIHDDDPRRGRLGLSSVERRHAFPNRNQLLVALVACQRKEMLQYHATYTVPYTLLLQSSTRYT